MAFLLWTHFTAGPEIPALTEEELSLPVTEPEFVVCDYDADPSSALELPSSSRLTAFSLSNLEDPTLDERQEAVIDDAVDAIEDEAGCSFVLLNVESGRGIAYNTDKLIYGASSIKGPYSSFICAETVEAGDWELDDAVRVPYSVDSESSTLPGTYRLEELIEATILESDNNAFHALRATFDDEGFDDWTNQFFGMGISWAMECPYSTARTLAGEWLYLLGYLNQGSSTSQWLEGLLSQTNVSMIRDGLADTAAEVRNKAGWYDDSLVDAGLVDCDGQTYLMVVMSQLDDSKHGRNLVSDLAAAVFTAHASLDQTPQTKARSSSF